MHKCILNTLSNPCPSFQSPQIAPGWSIQYPAMESPLEVLSRAATMVQDKATSGT